MSAQCQRLWPQVTLTTADSSDTRVARLALTYDLYWEDTHCVCLQLTMMDNTWINTLVDTGTGRLAKYLTDPLLFRVRPNLRDPVMCSGLVFIGVMDDVEFSASPYGTVWVLSVEVCGKVFWFLHLYNTSIKEHKDAQMATHF